MVPFSAKPLFRFSNRLSGNYTLRDIVLAGEILQPRVPVTIVRRDAFDGVGRPKRRHFVLFVGAEQVATASRFQALTEQIPAHVYSDAPVESREAHA